MHQSKIICSANIWIVLKFFAYCEFHTAPEKDETMELGVPFGAGDVDALCIAGKLGDGILASSLDFCIGGRRGKILQLQQIAVCQVGIVFEAGLHVDVGIAAAHFLAFLALDACILFANG